MKQTNVTNWLLFGIFLSSLTTTIVWVIIGFGVNHTLQVVPRTLTSISNPSSLKLIHGISQNVRDSLVTVMDDLNHDGALHHINNDFGNHLHTIHRLVNITMPFTKTFPTQHIFHESKQWRNTTNQIIHFLHEHPYIIVKLSNMMEALDKDIPFHQMVQESHEWHGFLEKIVNKLKS